MTPKTVLAEFKSLYDCDCPAIIKMYDAFYKDSSIHLIIEFMNCGSLEDVSNSYGPIEEPVLAKMAYWVYLKTNLIFIHFLDAKRHGTIFAIFSFFF